MTYSTRGLLSLCGIVAVSSSSFAAILIPNSVIVPTPLPLPIVGAVVDTSTHAFVGKDSFNNVVFTGSETTTVYGGDLGNALGGLTFVYSVSNDVTSPDTIDRVTLTGFKTFIVDADFVVGGGLFPATVDRSFSGDVIGFSFPVPNSLLPGQTTAQLVLRTNAPADIPDTLSAIDGGTGVATSFGPAVPEPASLGLLSLGGVALLRRRRA